MDSELAMFSFFAIMILVIGIYVLITKGLVVGGVVMFTGLAVIGIISYAVWSWMTDG